MNNFFRAIIAGYGAKKLGGGCFGTIIVFILIWVALGQCSFSSRQVPPPQSYPAEKLVDINVESERTLAWNAAEIDFVSVIFFQRGSNHSNAQSTSVTMSIEGTILICDAAPLNL